MASKRTSPAKLLLAVLIAVIIFVGLALAEDHGRRYLNRRAEAQKTVAERDTAEKAVVSYTQALIKSYDQTSLKLLAKSATDGQISRVRLFMAYNHFELKRKLIAGLKRQDFEGVSVKGRRATVRAAETWGYRYLDEKTGEAVEDSSESLMVTYRLRREKSGWLVDSLEAKPLE